MPSQPDKINDKLFATEAADGIVPAGRPLHGRGDGTQNFIAHEVPVGVVDIFKSIEVEQSDTDRTAVPLLSGQFVHQKFQCRGPIP